MKLIMIFVGDVEQGRLLMDLNKYTHFTEEHKLRLINWVYLKRHTIRNERWLEISQKTELTKEERIVSKYKVVTCPQQLMVGFNKAHLIAALIHAHENIQVLDDNLRSIMDLTDENMNKFDLQVEVNKCRTSEYKRKMKEYLDIGEKNSKTKKK